MDYSINQISILSENCLLKTVADFNSAMGLKSATVSLSKKLNEKIFDKINLENKSDYSYLILTEDGRLQLHTKFYNYKEFRIKVINILKWIEDNATTDQYCNFFVDLKLSNLKEGPFKGSMFFKGNSIESLNKLKFVLSFDEAKVFSNFPERIDNIRAKSIKNIEPSNKTFKSDSIINDPNQYSIINSNASGVVFGTLRKGFLRMQYIGGSNYELKTSKILDVIHRFAYTGYYSTIYKSYTEEELHEFNKLVNKYKKIQKSYKNYESFKSEYPKIYFTVNLLDNEKILSQFYDILKDKIYDFISNSKFKYSDEWKLNYDSLGQVLQVKDATLNCKEIKGIEFINCKLENGMFDFCDFYLSDIKNSKLSRCNIYRETRVVDSVLIDSFSNRTTTIKNCDISGENSVTNSNVEGGIIRNTKMGKFAEISKSTKVIKYTELKTGFIVASDKVISKNPNQIKIG